MKGMICDALGQRQSGFVWLLDTQPAFSQRKAKRHNALGVFSKNESVVVFERIHNG